MGPRNRFYRIFSTPLMLINYFKKSKWDNFVGGLIFGAIFSLIVNVFTIQLQETIQRQRILESVENEILENALIASNILKFDTLKLKNNADVNYYETFSTYSNDVWNTSEGLKYIVQQPADVQISIETYYKFGIAEYNKTINKDNDLAREKLSECYFNFDGKLTNEQIYLCKMLYHQLLQNQIKTAEVVGKNSLDLLRTFHPTKDRLNNFFLRIMMGGNAPKSLST